MPPPPPPPPPPPSHPPPPEATIKTSQVPEPWVATTKFPGDVNTWTLYPALSVCTTLPPVALQLAPPPPVDAPNPNDCPNRVNSGALVNKSYACVLKSPFTSPRTS